MTNAQFEESIDCEANEAALQIALCIKSEREEDAENNALE